MTRNDDSDEDIIAESVTIYDIAAENGKKFCECKKDGNDIILATKQGSISFMLLMEQVMNRDIAYRMRHGNRLGNPKTS